MTAQWPVRRTVITPNSAAPARLHRASIRLPIEGELPSLDGAAGWLKLGAADRRRPAEEGRVGQLLHLYLHQLATPATPCPRLECQVRRPRAGGARRAHAPSSSLTETPTTSAEQRRKASNQGTSRARRISASDTLLPRPIDRRRSR